MHTRPRPRNVPVPLRREHSRFQASMRAVLRSLPMVSQITPGQRQSWALRDLVFGRAQPCWTLEQAIADLIARAETRADAETVLFLAEHLRLEIAARIDAKFGAEPVAFSLATVGEQRADNELDLVQAEAGTMPSLSLLHRCKAAATRQLHALRRLVDATEHEIRQHDAQAHWT